MLGMLRAATTWPFAWASWPLSDKESNICTFPGPMPGTPLIRHWQQVVARRALLRWLYGELSMAATPDSPSSSYFERAACGRFQARGAWQLHLFVSQPPCGDACIATAPELADAQTWSLDSVGCSGAACVACAPELVGEQAPSSDEFACNGAHLATAPQLSWSSNSHVAAAPELADAETRSCHSSSCSSGACVVPELCGAHALSHDHISRTDPGVEALGAGQKQPADAVTGNYVAGETGSGMAPVGRASSLVPDLGVRAEGTLPAALGSVLELSTPVGAALLAVRGGKCDAEQNPLGYALN